jgi:hypothetical protein
VLAPIARALRNQAFNLAYTGSHIDPVTSVGVFSRFDNPDILRHFVPALNILHDLIIIKIILLPVSVLFIVSLIIILIVRMLFGLRVVALPRRGPSPNLLLLFPLSLQLFVPLRESFSPLSLMVLGELLNFGKVIAKTTELCSVDVTLLDEVGKRENFEGVLTNQTVILTHVHKDSLLVC